MLLEQNGLWFQGRAVRVKFGPFVFDLPARCFIKKVQYHIEYNSCQYCTCEGQFIFRGTISRLAYKHFLPLHVATHILSNPEMCQDSDWNSYANYLLNLYVEQLSRIYGDKQMCPNVHSLLHLCPAVLRFGPLENFSVFDIESYLGSLKNLKKEGLPCSNC